jgi:hypothetical protein
MAVVLLIYKEIRSKAYGSAVCMRRSYLSEVESR